MRAKGLAEYLSSGWELSGSPDIYASYLQGKAGPCPCNGHLVFLPAHIPPPHPSVHFSQARAGPGASLGRSQHGSLTDRRR